MHEMEKMENHTRLSVKSAARVLPLESCNNGGSWLVLSLSCEGRRMTMVIISTVRIPALRMLSWDMENSRVRMRVMRRAMRSKFLNGIARLDLRVFRMVVFVWSAIDMRALSLEVDEDLTPSLRGPPLPMAGADGTMWSRVSALAVAAAAASMVAVILSASISWRRSKRMGSKIRDLEASLEAAFEKCASERRGRVNAQQALRKALAQQNSDELRSGPVQPLASFYYPMVPIGTVQSCFSTRYGTPRQPLLVPLARAFVVFDQGRVPPQALEGLADYSHCWILYVFHLNTNLDKLWEHPARSKIKAKVRVPRLKGGKMGVLATRSPHRPCPIGLTVAKVEAVDGCVVLLSGVDLVDGTPVLDIKPYLPYSDCIQGATIPDWVKEDTLTVASVTFSVDFLPSLSNCWVAAEKQSMYSSAEEFQCLIKEVLSWDIRSLSQHRQPHQQGPEIENYVKCDSVENSGGRNPYAPGNAVTYHLVLEGICVSYKIERDSNILVERADLVTAQKDARKDRLNHSNWRAMMTQLQPSSLLKQ
ncbi:hypothetical protein J5N97_026813 [Dioscorea zingiberensis]|uniref:TsaA-like domain-containing protein n=1 Tax=Dioscorea zingiberensis TaxID=325984 RepID=A0A9D5C327_9LILI|nr:hypothetical protein J5N97_026813 [Dioscorea zingiberensis]